jgi:hypothetical protein
VLSNGKKIVHLIGLMGVLCDMAAGIETDTEYEEMVTVLNLLGLDPQVVLVDKTVIESLHYVAKEFVKIKLSAPVYKEIETYNEEISQSPE